MDEKSDSHFKNKPAESEQLRRVNQQLEAANQQLGAAKEELLKSRQRYQAAFDGVNEAIAVYAPLEDGRDFVLKNLNISAERTEGVKKENTLGKCVIEVFPRVQESGLFDVFRNVWESGKAEKFLEAICKEQQIIAWRENYIFKSGTGEIVNVFEDITESKLAGEKLAEEHNLLRLLIDSMPDYIYVKNTNSEFVVGNMALASGVGLDDPEGLLGNTDYDFFPQELASKYYKDEQDVIKSGEPLVNEEELVVDRQGSKKWFLTTKVPWWDRGGNKLGIIGIGRDITDRKGAEEKLKAVNRQLAASEQQLRAANQQLGAAHQQLKVEEQRLRATSQQLKAANQHLRESEEKLRSMFELSPFSMVLLDLEGNIRDCNHQFVKFHATKKGPEAQVGRNISEFFPPEQRQLLFGVIERTIKEKKTIIGPVEYIMSREDGSTFPAEGFSIVMLDSTGSPEVVLGLTDDITERKKAEEALRESEQRYRAIFEQAADSIVLVDAETGLMVEFNDRAHESLGYTREEFEKLKVADFEVIESNDDVKRHLEKVVKQGSDTFESKQKTKGGDIRTIQVSARAISIHGKYFIQGIWRDITEHKKAEQAIHESEQRFRDLYENAPNAYFSVGVDGRIRRCNRQAGELLGYAMEELVERPVLDLYAGTPHGKEKAAKVLERFLAGETVHDEELQMQKADGTPVWISLTVNAVRGAQGRVVESRSMVVDVTESKRAEQELKKSKDLLEKTFLSLDSAIFLLDSASPPTILDCNPAATKIFGYEKHEMLGRTTEFLHASKDTLFEFQGVLFPAIEKQGFLSDFEFRMKRKNGEMFATEHSVVPLKDDRGNRAGWISVVRDIAERKRAEQELQEAHDELEIRVGERTAQLVKANMQLQKETAERMRKEEMLRESERLAAVGSLAAKIAHEINNPLAGIKNSFLLIKDSIPDSHPYYKYVALIEKEIERVGDIVRQMYDLYGPVQASERDFRLREAVADVVALLKVASEEHKVNISIDIDDGIVVRLPDGLLRQVLFNIIQNAIEASHSHSIVKVTAGICEDVLSMKVIDSGVGISEDISEKIFEPFFTSKRDDAERGLGLGLSVCKNIVDSIGGEVTVQSRVGKGTTFTINIPLKNKNAESENG